MTDIKSMLVDATGNYNYISTINTELKTAMHTRSFTIRNLQKQVKSGESIECLAELYNLPVEEIQIYADPIEMEKKYAITQFHANNFTYEDKSYNIRTLLIKNFNRQGISFDEVYWFSYKNEGGPWRINALYYKGNDEMVATWSFYPKSDSPIKFESKNEIAKKLLYLRRPKPVEPVQKPVEEVPAPEPIVEEFPVYKPATVMSESLASIASKAADSDKILNETVIRTETFKKEKPDILNIAETQLDETDTRDFLKIDDFGPSHKNGEIPESFDELEFNTMNINKININDFDTNSVSDIHDLDNLLDEIHNDQSVAISAGTNNFPVIDIPAANTNDDEPLTITIPKISKDENSPRTSSNSIYQSNTHKSPLDEPNTYEPTTKKNEFETAFKDYLVENHPIDPKHNKFAPVPQTNITDTSTFKPFGLDTSKSFAETTLLNSNDGFDLDEELTSIDDLLN